MADNHWTLDKRVPLGIIFAMVMQASAFIWYAAKMDSRVASLEYNDKDQSSVISAIVAAQNQTNVTLAEIKKDQNYAVDALREIKSTLKGKQ